MKIRVGFWGPNFWEGTLTTTIVRLGAALWCTGCWKMGSGANSNSGRRSTCRCRCVDEFSASVIIGTPARSHWWWPPMPNVRFCLVFLLKPIKRHKQTGWSQGIVGGHGDNYGGLICTKCAGKQISTVFYRAIWWITMWVVDQMPLNLVAKKGLRVFFCYPDVRPKKIC